jgi:UDPglucose 6-dehydrogenase
VRGKTIAVLGLTFKPETDDMRDAASIPIVHRLASNGARIRAFDPEGMEQAKPLLPGSVTYCKDAREAMADADATVLLTAWNDFRALSPAAMKEIMRGDVLVDMWNVYDPIAIRQAGLKYHSIGRG